MLEFGIAMAIAITCSVAGDFFVKKGTADFKSVSPDTYGGIHGLMNPRHLVELLGKMGIFKNHQFWIGIGLLTVHFIAFMLAMRNGDVTVVVPLMACTYIATAFLGQSELHEKVSSLRWIGVGVIVLGVAAVGVSTLGSTPQSTPKQQPMKAVAGLVQSTNHALSPGASKKGAAAPGQANPPAP